MHPHSALIMQPGILKSLTRVCVFARGCDGQRLTSGSRAWVSRSVAQAKILEAALREPRVRGIERVTDRCALLSSHRWHDPPYWIKHSLGPGSHSTHQKILLTVIQTDSMMRALRTLGLVSKGLF